MAKSQGISLVGASIALMNSLEREGLFHLAVLHSLREEVRAETQTPRSYVGTLLIGLSLRFVISSILPTR